MELLVIFLAIIVVGYLVLHKTNHKLKATSQTKQEIITRYENELKTLLEECKNDSESCKEQKALYLKKCNDELSRNIFFTPEESKEILQKLAQL